MKMKTLASFKFTIHSDSLEGPSLDFYAHILSSLVRPSLELITGNIPYENKSDNEG